jgi:plasmid stabilization system protein ParE
MDKTITWKPKAIQQYHDLVQFLKDEFSEATAEKFVEKVTAKMAQLERYPESGLATRLKTVRRAKVGKLNSFYYRISGTKVIILFVWNARQDPKNNPYR